MADINKYISSLSGQLFLSQMDAPRRARLEQLKILGTGYKEQIGTLDPILGIYTGGWDPNSPLPDPTLPPYDITTDDDWKKIYAALQITLRDMANDRKAVTKDNPDAEKLLTTFYGAGLLVEEFIVNTTLTGIIGIPATVAFTNFLDEPQVRIWLDDNISAEDQDKLISALRDGTYVKRPDILRNLQQLAAIIYNDFAAIPTGLANPCPFARNDFYTIYQNTKEPKPPTTAILDNFKDPENHKKIFAFLAENPKALEAFSGKDNSGIATAIATGVNKNNYKEGKFALMPMDEHSLSLYQKAENKVNYIKNDMLGKMTMRHKRHPYYMDETAKPIMEALLNPNNPKNKFDITKGLPEFLTKVESVKASLGNFPKAIPHLEYLEKTLKDIKNTLPQEFDGALKDSGNMQAIVNAIIERAVDSGKIDFAQTALECLAMMRYGYFTSGRLNAIGKENIVLLGDPGLSFNKNNKGMQFVTKIFDRSAKAILMLGAHGGTLAHNVWKRRKLYFNDGTAAVKLMSAAQDKLSTMGPITPALIATLNTEVQTTRTAYEVAKRGTTANEKEIKKLENEWKLAEMVLATAEQIDPITGDRKTDNKLTQKQDLMAFWNYVNDPNASGRDLNIFRNGRHAQNYQNQIMGTGNMRKVDNLSIFQQQFYDKSIAA